VLYTTPLRRLFPYLLRVMITRAYRQQRHLFNKRRQQRGVNGFCTEWFGWLRLAKPSLCPETAPEAQPALSLSGLQPRSAWSCNADRLTNFIVCKLYPYSIVRPYVVYCLRSRSLLHPCQPRSKFPAVSLTKPKSSFLFLLPREHPLAGPIANQINPIIDWLFDLRWM
jgi:hypothetical protein